jgi:hypothetical protein
VRLDRPPFNESYDVALTWEINAYGSHAIKQTAHLSGAQTARPAYITLIDPPDPVAAPRRVARSWFTDLRIAIAAVPVLGPAARRVWRWFKR